MTTMIGENTFTLAYYADMIKKAQDEGYKFVTLGEFWDLGCPTELHFVLRHDLDMLPLSLKQMIDVERDLNVRSTTYFRICSNTYNPFGYNVLPQLLRMVSDGFEIGLHTNFVEFFELNSGLLKTKGAMGVLEAELVMARQFFDISSMSTHRDHNYTHNSLPFVNDNWDTIKEKTGLRFHAYDNKIMNNAVYINEGSAPHLTWRGKKPEEVIPTHQSICMLTHSHWWYSVHPFEHAQ